MVQTSDIKIAQAAAMQSIDLTSGKIRKFSLSRRIEGRGFNAHLCLIKGRDLAPSNAGLLRRQRAQSLGLS